MFDAKQAVKLMEDLQVAVDGVKAVPELALVARALVQPLLSTNGAEPTPKKRYTMSAATRKRISIRQKKYWRDKRKATAR